MNIRLSTSLAGLLLLAGVGVAAAEDVVIAPEQETVVREYVKKQPLASVKIPGVELNVGTALPDTVELHEVPNVQYRYVVVDGQTVLVDPGTRKIVKIIH
jgi:predicted fused transcriptional regulator/phosphomethylpyrimidine kinase